VMPTTAPWMLKSSQDVLSNGSHAIQKGFVVPQFKAGATYASKSALSMKWAMPPNL